MIPADTVDAAGNVWETTGENIRHGERNFSTAELKSIIDYIFPIGAIFCGESSPILSVGKWEMITILPGALIRLGTSIPSGQRMTAVKMQEIEGETVQYVSLRMYQRTA